MCNSCICVRRVLYKCCVWGSMSVVKMRFTTTYRLNNKIIDFTALYITFTSILHRFSITFTVFIKFCKSKFMRLSFIILQCTFFCYIMIKESIVISLLNPTALSLCMTVWHTKHTVRIYYQATINSRQIWGDNVLHN